MIAGSRAGSGSCIPANALRVVQELKEIVNNSDDEIYAMLKECDMDPNEAVQRLLNQGTFREVKRKRDKKKENANKESGEIKPRASGTSPLVQGTKVSDRSNGWGNYTSRYNPEYGRRRVQSFSGRDNGKSRNAISPSMITPAVLPKLPQAQIKASSMGSSVSNTAGAVIFDPVVVSNGTASYASRPQVACGGGSTVGSGHATIDNVIISSNLQKYATAAPLSSPKASSVQQLTSSSSSLPPDVYAASSCADPILHSALELSTMGLVATQQDVTKAPALCSSIPESLETLYQNVQPSTDDLSSLSLEADVRTTETDATSTSMKAFSEGQSVSELQSTEADSSFETPIILSLPPSELRTMPIGDQNDDRLAYQAPQQPVVSQEDWKQESPMKAVTPQASVAIMRLSPPALPQASTGSSDPASQFQQLNMQDDQPVIIPNHLQVPEAEQTHLSFGSFRDDLSTPLSTNFASEEDNRTSAHIEDNLAGPEPPSEHFNASSLMNSASTSLEQNDTSQSTASLMESFVGSNNMPVSLPANVISPVTSQLEGSKTSPVSQQISQYTYLSGVPNYTSFGIMPQLMGTQYNHEVAESQKQNPSQLPRFVLPLLDLGTNYYTPLLPPVEDVEGARYSHFVSTNAAAKLNPGATLPTALPTGQSISLSQEVRHPVAILATGPTSQTAGSPQTGHIFQQTGHAFQQTGHTIPAGIPQTGHTFQQTGHTIPQTGHTIPQQPIAVHAYPAQHAGIPLAPLGANIVGLQYVPPNYGYMPSLYQHSFAMSTGYPQAYPANTYTSTGSSLYVPMGTGTIKYALPQYKPGTAASSIPHAASAAGYGSLLSPSGFVQVSAVTTPIIPGYNDASGTPFKENSIHIPSQQEGEGSTVWVQTPLSRNMMGMQNNSFHTLVSQGQLSGHAHFQPTHAVPATVAAYTNLYHPSPSNMPPTVHQLLQQSQSGGGVVGGAGEIGAHQQGQLGQLNWTNTNQRIGT